MRKSAFGLLVLTILWALPASARQQSRNRKPTPPARPVPTVQVNEKKYPSLLWEISGNGLKKPSYLFGTMHVSDKLAFHLGDSFYHAIKSADIVALETNPESWQDDFSRSVFYRDRGRGGRSPGRYNRRWAMPNDYMRITTFAIDSYDEAIKAALVVEPSMINGMLYRTYGTQLDDFEEDTFLDMYIFQVGKKLGKRLSGVEDFDESEKLVMEAYRDMVRDENKKKRSYDYEGMVTNPKKVEDAYRKGDLDMLDSLESLTVFSDAFQEKFLYKRNEIQANSIDTIIRKSSLFVGVGAAHLPGPRGVIEMLRRKGYTLRPVQMDDRNSIQKETIEKTRTNNPFATQTSDDGFYKVDIPGKKFYRFTDWSGMDVVQYADMVNGAYYMVTRIKTNSLFWGHSNEVVYRKIDSLLYENIPGKILKKTPVTKDGYTGLDISNRTRRGDNQRYQVFVTPFEIIVFKMSGNGEYVTQGTEAQQFFGSIHLKSYQSAAWMNWQPATGGFAVQLPHTPSLLHDNNYGTDRLEYAAHDVQDGNNYLVMKVNLHNYSFIEADSFELNLMNESYAWSSFIDKQLSRRFTTVNGYPALECTFKHKNGTFSAVKYVIKGPVYYTQVAQYKKENANVQRFLQSFSITPFVYPAATKRVDSLLHIVVRSPIYPEEKKESSADELEDMLRGGSQDEMEGQKPVFATRLIGNDTIGEKILVTYLRMPDYSYQKDTSRLWNFQFGDSWTNDTSFIYKVNKESTLSNGVRYREVQLTDTGSSRLLLSRMYYKNGNFFSVTALTDTLSKRSPFLDTFFTSFALADSLTGESLLTRKTERLFKDLFSKDSVTAGKARKAIFQAEFDSTDAPFLKSAIGALNWNMPGYLNIKRNLIEQLGVLHDTSAATYLQQLYWKIKDTSDLQHAILNALLSQRTKASFLAFKNLILQEPPIVDDDSRSYGRGAAGYEVVISRPVNTINRNWNSRNFRYQGAWSGLSDTLSLVKCIFPDFLQLMNVDDYREEVMNLLVLMVDSGYLKASDYETYFSKIYLDGKQLLKKQLAKENKEKMEKAGRSNKPSIGAVLVGADDDEEADLDAGNEELDEYAVLLLPFREKNPGVQSFFEQLMITTDRRLLYNSFILLLRNHQPVPDSLFTKFAALDKYRAELYEDLEANRLLAKFPAKYKNQQDITRSIIVHSSNRYEKMDTLIYLDKLPVQYDDKKGTVYFYKYRRMRDDVEWQVISVGMQPEKADVIDMDNNDFTNTRDDHKLDNSKPVKEQLQKILKEMLYARHASAQFFYEARSFSMYKNYLSEMVKNRRYKD